MIIVTGAAGFIGSNIARALNERGEKDLILVDIPATAKDIFNFKGLKYSKYLPKESLKAFLNFAEGVRGIFHMGACSSTTETNMDYLRENNFEYTRDLASWCLNNGAQFIYASSAATYGDGSFGYHDNESQIESLKPLNLYGYSKQLFDLWAMEGGHFSKIVGLKYFNVFGPGEYHKGDMRSMILKAYLQIQESGKVRLFKSLHPDYKDGEQMRDFIYIREAVDMTLHFFENPEARPGLYNVGTGKARTWVDLMKAIYAALYREPQIEFIPLPEAIKNNYQYFTEADMTKMRERGGYRKSIPDLEISVKDYVEKLKDHFLDL